MKMEEAKKGMKVVDTDTGVTGVITHIDRELGVITVDDRQAPYGEKRFAQNYYDCGSLYDIADLEVITCEKLTKEKIKRYNKSPYVRDVFCQLLTTKLPIHPHAHPSFDILEDGTVTVTYRGKTAKAKCHPDDKFDICKGLELAFERMAKKLGVFPKWEPKEGEKHFYVFAKHGLVSDKTRHDWDLDDEIAIALGNCFKTREEAEKHKDTIVERYKKLAAYAKELNQ